MAINHLFTKEHIVDSMPGGPDERVMGVSFKGLFDSHIGPPVGLAPFDIRSLMGMESEHLHHKDDGFQSHPADPYINAYREAVGYGKSRGYGVSGTPDPMEIMRDLEPFKEDVIIQSARNPRRERMAGLAIASALGLLGGGATVAGYNALNQS